VAIRSNVTRLLDSKNIPYTVHELPTDDKLGAVDVASILNLPPEKVYKTIVATRAKSGKSILALVPAPDEVDLKALAAALGEKRINLATEREAERLTALKAGGISALALLTRPFQVVIDSSAINYPEIYMSAGQRGLDIGIAPAEFIQLTSARVAAISKHAGP
jgi:Cys-tRNA(Pro)/Cys-tRNA(Cys) deacylase